MVPRAKARSCKATTTGTCFACSALVREFCLVLWKKLGIISEPTDAVLLSKCDRHPPPHSRSHTHHHPTTSTGTESRPSHRHTIRPQAPAHVPPPSHPASTTSHPAEARATTTYTRRKQMETILRRQQHRDLTHLPAGWVTQEITTINDGFMLEPLGVFSRLCGANAGLLACFNRPPALS